MIHIYRFTFFVFVCFGLQWGSAQSPYTGSAPYVGENGGLMINEFSQGDSGQKEYIEYVVVGAPSDPLADVNLEGFILDDNNFPASGNGTSEGHFRLGDCYDAVAPGSIIVIYNADDVNASLPPDDPEDSDGDDVYIIPHNSSCLNMCNSNPVSPTNEFHCPCESFGGNDWESIVMRNGGDVIQVRDGCGTLHHVIVFGSQPITSEITNSPTLVNTGYGSQSGQVVFFSNENDDNWLDVTNYRNEPVAGNSSPGGGNTPENASWISSIANGSYPYDGEIADCRKTDAGDLEWPSDGDPGGPDPLEICEGTDIGAFSPDWSASGNEEPDPNLFNFEYGFVLTEPNPPYEVLDFNITGDFDFSTLAPGTYRVWGVSFLYVNGEEDFLSFMNDACVEDIEVIEDFAACDYDCGIDVDVTNNSVYNGEVIIEILPAPDDPTDPMIGPFCEAEAADYDLTDLIDIINNGSGLTVTFFDGEPGAGGVEISDPSSVDLNGLDLWIQYGEEPCIIIFDLTDPMITSGPTLDPIGPFTFCIPSGSTTATIDLTAYHSDLHSDPGFNFFWYEDAGLTQAVGNPVAYSAGQGTTTLYVQGEDGVCESNVIAVVLEVQNSPDINTGVTLEGCEPAPADFDLTEAHIELNANAGINFNWFENPDGSGEISNPEDYSGNAGDVYVSVTDPATGCSSDTVSVELILHPEPSFTVINDVTVCEGLEVSLDTLVDPSNSNLSYTFHDGFPPNTGNQINGPVSFNSNTTIWVVGTDDATGCTSIEEVNVDVIAIPVTPPVSNSGPYCEGETIQLSYDFPIPIPGLQFSWTGPNGFSSNQENPNIPNAPPSAGGEYNLVVSLFGCSSQPAETNVVVNPLPILDPQTPIVVCEGEALTLMVDGPAGTSYSWSGPNGFSSTEQNPLVTGSASPVDAGDYVVFGALNGCVGPDTTVEVSVLAGADIEIQIDNEVQCAGDDDGEISVIINNGNPPFDYSWSDPQYDGLNDLDGLSAGIYSVTVTDGNGCTSEAEIELIEPEPLMLFCTEIDQESFPGAEDGSAGIDISGGTPTYNLTYDNNDGTNGTLNDLSAGVTEIENLPAGSYDVVVTDANGCTVTCSFTITDPGCEVEIEEVIILQDVLCFGDSTASLEAIVNGGSGTYIFTWFNSAGDEVGSANPITDLPADNYTLTVADAFDMDCERNIMIEVPEIDPLVLNCEVISEVSAPGASDGTVEITFSGGTPGYSIIFEGQTLTNSTSPLQIDTLSPGTYPVEVIDDNGCSTSCSFTLQEVDCDLSIDELVVIDSLLCWGDSTAVLSGLASGGDSTNYSFTWTAWPNGDTLSINDTVMQLPAGIYQWEVRDGDCVASDTLRVPEPEDALLILNCEVLQNVSAPGNADGEVLVEWTGGVPVIIPGNPPSYTVNLVGPGIDTTYQISDLSVTINNLPAGTYNVEITDSIPCFQFCSFTLSDTPCDLDISLDTAFFAGCPADSSLEIRLLPNPLDSHVILVWNNDTLSQTTRTGLPADNYMIQAIDTLSNCRDTLTVDFPAPPAPILNCFVIEDASAPGESDGSLGVTMNNVALPYDLTLSGPAGDIDSTGLRSDSLSWTDLPAGNYALSVTDSLGCTTVCNLVLNDGDCDLMLDLNTAFFSGCPSDSTLNIRLDVLNPTQNTIYIWNTDTLTELSRVELAAGFYEIIALDTSTFCADTVQLTREDESQLSFACEVFLHPSSFGSADGQAGILIDTISAPYTVSIAGFNYSDQISESRQDSIRFNNLDSGTYIITVENSWGCTDTCQLTIEDGGCGVFTIDSIVRTQPTCNNPNDGQLEVFVSGGSGNYTYDWVPDSLTGMNPATGLSAGSYFVTVTDTTQNCIATGSSFILAPQDLDISLDLPNSICSGDSATVEIEVNNGVPPYILSIDGTELFNFSGDTSFQIASSDILLFIEDRGTCSFSQILSFDELPLAQSLIDLNLCPGDSIEVGDSTFTEAHPIGMVRLPGAASNGCDSVVNVSLNYLEANVEFNLLPPSCDSFPTTTLEISSITGNPPYTLRLNGNEETINNLPLRRGGQVGSNSFTVTNAAGCESELYAFTGTSVSEPEISIEGPPTILLGDTATLLGIGLEGLLQIQWSPGSVLSCDTCTLTLAAPTSTTSFELTAVDTNGCAATATYTLRVIEPEEDYFIPNIFSPNGDGINDHFTYFASPGSATITSLQIFDRWGNLLFEQQQFPINAPNLGWDGRAKGQVVNPGVYIYAFEILTAENETLYFKGSVTVTQ
jgi:gliding motility-associated-like protein